MVYRLPNAVRAAPIEMAMNIFRGGFQGSTFPRNDSVPVGKVLKCTRLRPKSMESPSKSSPPQNVSDYVLVNG